MAPATRGGLRGHRGGRRRGCSRSRWRQRGGRRWWGGRGGRRCLGGSRRLGRRGLALGGCRRDFVLALGRCRSCELLVTRVARARSDPDPEDRSNHRGGRPNPPLLGSCHRQQDEGHGPGEQPQQTLAPPRPASNTIPQRVRGSTLRRRCGLSHWHASGRRRLEHVRAFAAHRYWTPP